MEPGEIMTIKKCLNCGMEILSKNKYYCCQKCRAKYIRNKKTCVICGKEFFAPPTSGKKTCSKKSERVKNGKSSLYARTMALAQKAAKESPNSGQYETNAVAKSWVIQSPEGKVYKINNLSLWARENEAILPSSAKLFAAGMRDIKRSEQGKKKRGSLQYKGWLLLSWSEENEARKRKE